jgi:chlorophyllide a reductase subunit Y
VVQKAKAKAIPALYFTNLISARPLFGVAGAGSLAQVVNAAIAGKARFDTMREFFEGVGEGDTAGVWQDMPVARPDFREKFRKAAAAQARKRKSEEMV